SKNESLRKRALDKAKNDHDYSIHSLVNLIENIDIYKGSPSIRKYLRNNEIHIYYI
ncbi:unnamed protein product, partial [marine sediment metagenome]